MNTSIFDDRVKCLETRRTPDGFVRRRYLMDNGSRLTTIEAPAAVFKVIGSQAAWRLTAHKNGREIRASAAARKRLVLKLSSEGALSNVQIAKEAVCTEARVRQIVAEAAKKGGAA
jgi:hypothetical protein